MNILEDLIKNWKQTAGMGGQGSPSMATPGFVPPGMQKPNQAPAHPPMLGAGNPAPAKPPIDTSLGDMPLPTLDVPQTPPALNMISAPDRQKVGMDSILPEIKRQSQFTPEGLMEIESPQRSRKSGMIDKPWYKDKDNLRMGLAQLSNAFYGMGGGKNPMAAMNNAQYARGMKNKQQNKTMDYMIQQNPEMAKKLMQLPPEIRDQYMGEMVKASFAGPDKESAFAEKVRMLEATGVPRSQAVSQVLSGGGTNISVSTGGGAKPFESKIGENAAEWVSGRSVTSRGNRREANRVIGDLETAIANGEAITGSFASYMPESIRNLVDAEGLDMQQSVERIVQQSLKETLGAQFAQKEAEQLFARTWNPKASPQVNLRRTKRLLGELDAYAANMDHISSGMLQSDGNILKWLGENPLDQGSIFGDSIYDIEYEDDFDTAGINQQPEAAPKTGGVVMDGKTYYYNEATGEYETDD